jgi:hypothetical protein
MAKAADTVSLSEFAAHYGKSEEWARKLAADGGMPHRIVDGHYRLVTSVASAWLIEQAETREGLDKDQEIAEKTRVERQIKELELAERRGQLVPVTQYQERVEEFVGGFAGMAMGQLQRFEREVVQAGDAATARRLMGKIQAALMRGAQEYADTLETEIAATTEDAA